MSSYFVLQYLLLKQQSSSPLTKIIRFSNIATANDIPIIGTIQMSLCCNEGVKKTGEAATVISDETDDISLSCNERIEETGEAATVISDETADNTCPGISTVTVEDIGALYSTPLAVTTLDI